MKGEGTVVAFPHEDERQIVAFGGGGFSMEAGNPLLDEYVMSLARRRRERPRVCFLPTASGDADHYLVASTGRSREASASRRTSLSSAVIEAPAICAPTCSPRT